MRCGLLGRKLAHSYSPAIHAAFGGYSYELFEVEPEKLADFFSTNNFHGINVTIPYKQDVIPFCDELSPVAREIGSVNTILRKPDGSLFGDNTDAAGFRKMVEQLAASPLFGRGHTHKAACTPEAGCNFIRGKKVIIFGSGGGSFLSVQYVMKHLNAGEIVPVSIDDNNEEFLRPHADAEILVNCTPVGMYPNVADSPAVLEMFPKLEGVLDIVFNPARTRLMQSAAVRGIPCIGGLVMLVGQAAVSSEIFTGKNISDSEEKAVVKKLRRRMENIILIGMPGSGKTTHGRLLAEKLNKPFVDIDAEIVKAEGRSIPEIFAAEGEPGFREKETAVLAKFGKESGLVIATGGGCVTREENYAHLHQNGTIVFNERDISKLVRQGRPLSQGDLKAMYEIRLPMYRRFADISVDANASPDVATERIAEALV